MSKIIIALTAIILCMVILGSMVTVVLIVVNPDGKKADIEKLGSRKAGDPGEPKVENDKDVEMEGSGEHENVTSKHTEFGLAAEQCKKIPNGNLSLDTFRQIRKFPESSEIISHQKQCLISRGNRGYLLKISLDRKKNYYSRLLSDFDWLTSEYPLRSDNCYITEINFDGEEGLDAGGLSNEVFSQLGKEFIEEKLFNDCSTGSSKLCVNPQKESKTEAFLFLGRVMGLAFTQEKILGIDFAPYIYRFLASQQPCPTLSSSEVLQASPNLSGTLNHFGKTKEEEEEYKATLYEDYKWSIERDFLAGRIAPMLAMRKGFQQTVNTAVLSKISQMPEVLSVIEGDSNIDLEKWKKATTATTANDNIEKETISKIETWFWKWIESLEKTDQAKIFKFSTGMSRMPLELKEFSLDIIDGNTEDLPTASTCFNELHIPAYASKDIFLAKMECLLNNANEAGFGVY